VSGSSGNGLASLASTSTVTSSPWWASRTSSGLARASGRVEATTVTASSPGTGGFLPSVTVNGTVTRVPRGTAGWAWASTVVPCVPRVSPSAPPVTSTVRGSPSGSTTTRARSSDASSPAATSSSAVPRTSGGWLRLARTSIGNVSTAVRPSGSSGPSPSVTSNVTDAGPTYSSSEV